MLAPCQRTARVAAMASVFLRVTALAITVFAASSCGADPKSGTNRFEQDILAFEAADHKNPPPEGAILFVGDSLFTRWRAMQTDLPEHFVISRAFGGSQMSALIYYIERSVLPYKPRLIVVSEGDNDIHRGVTPDAVLAGMKTFVEKIHAALPKSGIAISGLTPRPARWSEADVEQHVNRIIQDYVSSQR